MSTESTQIDVSAAVPPPPVEPTSTVASSPTQGTSPAPEADAGSVLTENGEQFQPQETDIFADIPTIDELQQQVERREPRAEGLLRLRTELERISPEYQTLSKYKSLTELGTPEELQAAYDLRSKLFSPVIDDNGQPKYDERGLQQRTSLPWVEAMESESPGFYQRHLDDLLRYVDPATGKNGAQIYFEGIGLDINRFEDYLNLDSLIAKAGGAVNPAELEAIPEADREAYKMLPASLRREWSAIEDDEKKWHLDSAKARIADVQRQERDAQAEESQRQQFQQNLQQTVFSDLSNIRKQGFTSLRDSIAKDVVLSTDPKVNLEYANGIVAPFALLLVPEFQELGVAMLEGMGIKLDQNFYDRVNAFSIARQQYQVALAYKDPSADSALKEADGKYAWIMAKLHGMAMERAKTFGHQAAQIASANGKTISTASAARVMPPNGSAVDQAQGILPAGMDPYSPEASKWLWQNQRR